MDDSTALLDCVGPMTPFLELIRDSLPNVSSVRAVVHKVLSHPEIFCGYDQLKALIITEGKTMVEDAQLLATLDLFSYGTYSDYIANPSQFLPLNDTTHMTKLRQLTLLSCVQDHCNNNRHAAAFLDYDTISQALHLTNDQRSMEQIIISCIYARALNGRLCQKSKQLILTQVPVCISRDVPLQNISKMMNQLEQFQNRLSTSIMGLEASHMAVSQSLEQSSSYWNSVQELQIKAQALAGSNKLQHSGPSTGGSSAAAAARLPGWPESGTVANRRPSASRQTKRSRGAVGGFFNNNNNKEPIQRF